MIYLLKFTISQRELIKHPRLRRQSKYKFFLFHSLLACVFRHRWRCSTRIPKRTQFQFRAARRAWYSTTATSTAHDSISSPIKSPWPRPTPSSTQLLPRSDSEAVAAARSSSRWRTAAAVSRPRAVSSNTTFTSSCCRAVIWLRGKTRCSLGRTWRGKSGIFKSSLRSFQTSWSGWVEDVYYLLAFQAVFLQMYTCVVKRLGIRSQNTKTSIRPVDILYMQMP